MGFDGMNDLGVFFVFLCDGNADFDMRAVDLMSHGFADIMQQSGALCKIHIRAKLCRDHSRNEGDLYGMAEYVLTVACAEAESAEQLDKLVIYTVNAGFEGSLFAFLLDDAFNFFFAFFNHFLNAGGMDSSVGNELFEGKTRDLASYGVKCGNRDCLGCVVDYEVDSGKSFDRTYISALTTYDSALHFVVRQVND